MGEFIMLDTEGLFIDLDNEEVEIDGFNSAFDGTPFYGKDFRIIVTPVTHKEYDRLRAKYTDRRKQRTDEVGFEKDLFNRQVVSWVGIKDPSGKDLPCNPETKNKIVNKVFFFARAINIACLNARMEAVEAEVKNSGKSGSGD